jgi:beta-exotoxin I transport system permease protein
MATELLSRGVLDHRRALLGWCVGVAAYIALLAAIFPSIEGSQEFDDLVEQYPEALKSLFGIGGNITTGPGFMDVELFGLMLPLLALVLAIGSGARLLAGEEEAGRLELLLAYPVLRRSAVLAKGAAVALDVAALSAAAFAALALLSPVFGLDLSLGRLAGAVLGVWLLAVLHGWLTLAVGAFRPGRALAIGISAAVAAAGYLVGGLHELAGWLDPFRFLSAFWWIGQSPLVNGVDFSHFLVVGGAAVVVLAAGAWFFERRDLQTP